MTTETPKVSIVCAWYQRADHINLTVQSLLAQDFHSYEVIIINDGSPDSKVRERLDAFSDPRLKVIHQSNTGFVGAIRRAIEESRGAYIAVQGSGDVSLPSRIREQAALLDARGDVGVVGSWYHSVSDDGARLPRRPNADDTTLETLLQNNTFTHGEVMYRRSIYDSAGGYRPEFKYAQDIDLWLRAIRFGKFATVRSFLYDRYVRGDGVSYDADKRAEQIKLSILACRLATMPHDAQMKTLEAVRKHGVHSVISDSDPIFQAKVGSAIRRFLAWGNHVPAKRLNQLVEKPTSKIINNIMIVGAAGIGSTKPSQRILRYLRSSIAR